SSAIRAWAVVTKRAAPARVHHLRRCVIRSASACREGRRSLGSTTLHYEPPFSSRHCEMPHGGSPTGGIERRGGGPRAAGDDVRGSHALARVAVEHQQRARQLVAFVEDADDVNFQLRIHARVADWWCAP